MFCGELSTSGLDVNATANAHRSGDIIFLKHCQKLIYDPGVGSFSCVSAGGVEGDQVNMTIHAGD
jgi:hypothetical protein